MLLASPPARACTARFHGPYIMAASRIAGPFRRIHSNRAMVEIGFLPSEVEHAKQSGRGAVPLERGDFDAEKSGGANAFGSTNERFSPRGSQ